MFRHNLRSVQEEVLEALVNLYEKERRMIKSREVARLLGKEEGTVRNIIMWLKSMGYVESRTGPAGGYIPTLKAYEAIRGAPPKVLEPGYGVVVVFREGEDIRLTAISMEIMGLFSSEPARALVKVMGDLSRVEEGMRARIESLPKRKLVIEGIVKRRDLNANEMLLEITKMAVIPEEYVENVGSRRLITVRTTHTMREVARILHVNGIRGAPVVDEKDEVVGFITTADLAAVVANSEDLDAPVSKYMRKTVFFISGKEGLIEAMRYMDFHGVGRLLIVHPTTKKPIGIITRTDILKHILAI
ncbi:MAG: CBS domain-containing protein [Acidilobaceae archaeon]|nr:CBS domain-containing protein [Acidilobaceae archaeon]